MKSIAMTAFFTLVFAISCSGQAPCKEYSSPDSVFAFCPPAPLIDVKDPNQRHSVFVTSPDREQNRTAVIILEKALEAERELLAFGIIKIDFSDPKITNAALVEAIDFRTASGLIGTKIVITGDMFRSGKTVKDRVRHAWYIFDAPNQIQLAFFAVSLASDTEIAEVTEAAMKTVRLK